MPGAPRTPPRPPARAGDAPCAGLVCLRAPRRTLSTEDTSRDDDARPDPDALLERAKAEERDAKRSKLRIFFGASPGVGKTYAMLENAARLRRDGVDVVVGIVETHGRKETAALLGDLPQIPRRRLAYRGRTLDELDLDAALARKPAVILLDELAHTNAPGSRHQKRWQDAMELLDAGIEVHTTLNVQHVESLNDIIAQITHVRVRETVPDSVIERADEIELVDVPPEVVLGRLKEGKVYAEDQAVRAAGGFFKEGNLHALRELALRLTAERVETEVEAWRRQEGIEATWATRERVMVCVGPSPGSAQLVRSARRMAVALRAPWIAAYVERAPGRALATADKQRLDEHLRLAESLGAEVVMLVGEQPATAVLDVARRRNVTRIVVGKPTHARWRDFVYGSFVDDLVRQSGAIDVHVTSGDAATTGPTPAVSREARPTRAGRRDLGRWAQGLAPVATATALSWLVRDEVDLADIAMLFLVAIATTAAFLGRGPSLLAAVLAVACFDFFFVPPFFTFAVTDFRHLLTFVVMLCAGVLISTLTERIRGQSHAARERERRTAALYALTRELAGARDAAAIAAVAQAQLRDAFGSDATLLVRATTGDDALFSPAPSALALSEADRTVARWALEHGTPAGRGLDTLPGARVIGTPLLAGGAPVGVLAVLPEPEDRFADPDQRHLLATFVAQIALALERAQLEAEAREAQVQLETEEMRSSLLSAVSHDLRTPLAAILGSATTLIDESAPLPDAARAELLVNIRDEAARLARLISNLLDMTRVESGALVPKREWISLEEVVASALQRLENRIGERSLVVDVPPEIAVPLDPVLFEQVVTNLVENALKHTPPGTAIEIRGRAEAGRAVLEVRDHGPGLEPGTEGKIFDKFVRAREGGGGVGLGLAICRGIVHAHGGSISASNATGGGALFAVTLPVEGRAPSIPPEPRTENDVARPA